MARSLNVFDRRIPLPAPLEEPARTAFSAATWAILAGVIVGGFGVQVPIALRDRHDPTQRRAGRLFRDLGVLVAKLNPLWSFAVEGEVPAYVPSRTVVVSNHVSNSDAFLIAHLPWEMKWLGKASLFRVPVFGWLLQLAGDVPVVRGSKDSIVDAMKRCREHLEQGMPVMIFPEGTRSKSGELLPFKDGAFRLAIEAKADVLPVAVAGTREALPKHSWRFGFAEGRIRVGEPISTEAMTLDDVESLKAQARRQIEDLLGALAQHEAP